MDIKFTRLISIGFLTFLAACNQQDTKDTLVAQYTFNEGMGETLTNQVSEVPNHIKYVFNQQNQGQLYKEASDPLWNLNGIEGGSLLFDGYSTYIEDESVQLPTDEITISLWVAPRAFEWGDGGNLSSFVSQSNREKSQGVNFGMYRHGSWSLQLGVGDDLLSGWLEIWDNDHPLPVNEWSLVTATYDTKTATATLYLNGEIINQEVFKDYTGKPMKISDEIFTIGKSNNNVRIVGIFDVNMFNGAMDELQIYKTALSDIEVKDLYKGSVAKNEGAIPTIPYEDIALSPELYATDRYRPQYHAMPGGHWMNEPHAPMYYNGKYHLFYQHNPFGPFWHQINWGHWVSDDLVNWENVKPAISPTGDDITPDGVWTGCATYDKDGAPVLFFTAGNDSKSPNQSIGMARPKDLSDPNLTEWDIHNEIIVAQTEGEGDFGEFRDPFVWLDEETNQYFMLVGTGTNTNNGGTAVIYSSSDLYEWGFKGNIFESDANKFKFLGEHWELPVLLPVKSEDGSIKKDIFIVSPHGNGADVEVYYWLGHFDAQTARFIPDFEEPKLIDYGDGVFTGPSGFVDPATGRTLLFTIAQGADRSSWEDYYSGWAHTAGMPVELTLNNTGEVKVRPIREVESLRSEALVNLQNVSVEEANKALENIDGDMLEIILEVENINATKYGIKVRKTDNNAEFTSVYYDVNGSQLVLDRINSSMDKTGLGVRNAPVEEKENRMSIHILLDRSLIEIYSNDEVSMTSRIYPSLKESTGLEITGDGEVVIKNMEVYEMNPIFINQTKEAFYNN